MKKLTSILFGIVLTLSLTCYEALGAQPSVQDTCQEYSEAVIKLFFDLGSSRINLSLDSNRQALMEMDSLLKVVKNDSSWVVKNVSVKGSASPEGPVELNRRLSRSRAEAISRHFAAYTDDASIPTDFHYAGSNWYGLRRLVLKEPDVPDRDAIIHIIDSDAPDRLSQLKQLSGGATYRWLSDKLFPKLRVSTVTLSLHRECAPAIIKENRNTFEVDTIEEDSELDFSEFETKFEEVEPIEESEKRYIRNLYFKTNALAWAMAISNIAVEIDLHRHISVTLPIYYSAWEYGTHKVKFRTFALEPEVRFWTRPDNTGFFGGAHFGYAQYNMAIGGKYRYQDHNGNSPALGGGISLGYRCLLGHSRNWMMEFTLGGGAYHLHYDVFDNSSVPYGQKVDERRKTFFGIDNAGVTFIYVLPLIKKGGER